MTSGGVLLLTGFAVLMVGGGYLAGRGWKMSGPMCVLVLAGIVLLSRAFH